MPTEIARRRFTGAEFDRMVETGILKKEDRVELIEGEIVEMSPIGLRHSACTDRANMLLAPAVQGRAIVRIQGSFRLSDYSRPQPDVMLLHPRQDYYAKSGPVPRNALLVIEVAETSIQYDRGPKLALYAKYGVGEVWIEDLNTDTLLVFCDRHPKGYTNATTLHPGDNVAPLAFPDRVLKVSELLGV